MSHVPLYDSGGRFISLQRLGHYDNLETET